MGRWKAGEKRKKGERDEIVREREREGRRDGGTEGRRVGGVEGKQESMLRDAYVEMESNLAAGVGGLLLLLAPAAGLFLDKVRRDTDEADGGLRRHGVGVTGRAR